MSNLSFTHPIVTHYNDIQEITRPLEMLDISYFSHVKVDAKGNFSVICNNPEFIKHYIKKEYYNVDIHMAEKDVFNNVVVWDVVERHGKTKKMEIDAAQLGVQHTFTIIDQSSNEFDYYHFSVKHYNPSINQMYLSNLNLLQSFIKHFNEKIGHDKSLNDAHNIKFKLDNSKGNYEYNKNIIAPISENMKINFLSLVQSNNDECYNKILSQTLRKFYKNLTMREIQVALLMIKGKPARVIAENLNLAYKTIEHYIENIKLKLEAKSKSELIGMFVDVLFLNHI